MAIVHREVSKADIAKCPKQSLRGRHYREDGTCLCNEREHAAKEWRDSQADLIRAQQRVKRADEWLNNT